MAQRYGDCPPPCAARPRLRLDRDRRRPLHGFVFHPGHRLPARKQCPCTARSQCGGGRPGFLPRCQPDGPGDKGNRGLSHGTNTGSAECSGARGPRSGHHRNPQRPTRFEIALHRIPRNLQSNPGRDRPLAVVAHGRYPVFVSARDHAGSRHMDRGRRKSGPPPDVSRLSPCPRTMVGQPCQRRG